MPKFTILVTWTQDMSVERTVECETLEQAKELALSIDPNAGIDGEIITGDIVSDIEHFVDGDEVGVNNCPFAEEAD